MVPVFISTTNLTNSNSLAETLEIYHQAGIRAVELGSGHILFPGYLETITGFPFDYSVHNYFPLTDPDHLVNIASVNCEQLDKTKNIARNAIAICSHLGGSIYGIHAGYRSDLDAQSLGRKLLVNEETTCDAAFRIMVETIQELCDFASEKAIDVLVENHVLAPFNLVDGKNTLLLLCTAEEIVEFAKAVGRDNFGMLIDLAHLKVTAKTLEFDPYQFIQSVSPWIKLFHLSENNGLSDLGLPFDEGAWFEPVIKQFQSVPCVIETQVTNVSTLLRQLDLVTRWLSA